MLDHEKDTNVQHANQGRVPKGKVNRCLFLFFSAVNRQLTGGGEERRTLTACQPADKERVAVLVSWPSPDIKKETTVWRSQGPRTKNGN